MFYWSGPDMATAEVIAPVLSGPIARALVASVSASHAGAPDVEELA